MIAQWLKRHGSIRSCYTIKAQLNAQAISVGTKATSCSATHVDEKDLNYTIIDDSGCGRQSVRLAYCRQRASNAKKPQKMLPTTVAAINALSSATGLLPTAIRKRRKRHPVQI